MTLTITRWQNDSFKALGSPLSDYFAKRILLPSIVVAGTIGGCGVSNGQAENWPLKMALGCHRGERRSVGEQTCG